MNFCNADWLVSTTFCPFPRPITPTMCRTKRFGMENCSFHKKYKRKIVSKCYAYFNDFWLHFSFVCFCVFDSDRNWILRPLKLIRSKHTVNLCVSKHRQQCCTIVHIFFLRFLFGIWIHMCATRWDACKYLNKCLLLLFLLLFLNTKHNLWSKIDGGIYIYRCNEWHTFKATHTQHSQQLVTSNITKPCSNK